MCRVGSDARRVPAVSALRRALWFMVGVALVVTVALLMGCAPREIVREVIVPARIPSLCTSACPEPEGTPTTNGELAEAWAARGEALACYRGRQACVREMTEEKPK